MNASLSYRSLFLIALSGCLMLIGAAFYLQYNEGLEPCPLCYVQRIEVFLFAFICFLAIVHNPLAIGRKIYGGLALLTAGLGIATAGRQIWMQTLPPDNLPACLPSMEYMLEAFPLMDIISKTLHGTADCAKIDWTFFGLNLAQLSLISFTLMAIFSLFIIFRR